jgi:hypothetical protein
MAISPAPAALAFDCPRCGGASEDRFYGPCPSCRSELRRTLGTDGRVIEREAFEPAMHVTPNAVAQKD